MNTKPIIIEEDGQVIIRSSTGNVWLTEHQIADLFSVFVSAVGSNIRSILKSEVLREENVCRQRETANGSLMTRYNMEMIMALAFRLKSRQAELFRQWMVKQAASPVILWQISGREMMLN